MSDLVNAGLGRTTRGAMAMEWKKGEFSVTCDPDKQDLEVIHGFLSRSYWAKGITRETVRRSLDGSLCFALLHNDKQVGFARVISDLATIAYLGDVFVLEEYRGQGLSKWLMECVSAHPGLQGLRRWMLVTSDAHGLYEKYGFTALSNPHFFMERHNPNVYTRDAQHAVAADRAKPRSS
ncbi:GNAT family N-acetyltransferase [Sorangium sp. So ce1036]|uniref:GNAT family N-acetyltransferase n=1 Tax=Sorangium sp. So ce1036 TaxID=3133328 RepID=UPI003F10953F